MNFRSPPATYRRTRQAIFVAAAATFAAVCFASGVEAEPLASGIAFRDVEQRSYLSYVTETVDNLIEFGTDRYGGVQSLLLVSNLDVRTKDNPLAQDLAATDQAWRVERRERRAPGGSNFLHNQALYHAIDQTAQATRDLGYRQFVTDNMTWAMDNLVDANGMFWWGYHRHYDVHTDTFQSEPGLPYHEMHFVDVPMWERMWDVNPAAVELEIEKIWERHVVNKTTGQINRHDDPGGLSFISSSASFIDAFSFLSSKLPAEQTLWTDRAKLLANYNWNSRDAATDLIPHTPNETLRWDGARSATTTPALYVPALLRAYEFTGDVMFRDQALAYLKGWGEQAYDPTSGSFWGSLKLDGTPVQGPWASSGYEQFEPRGLIDLWAPEFITAQHNTDAALIYIRAARQFDDPELMATAEHWADLIRRDLPTFKTLDGVWYAGYSRTWASEGTYAEHYGHVIQFFIEFYEATGQLEYLASARDVADQAISGLWYDGLFRGHANKPYFEAVDGVGILMESLLALHGFEAIQLPAIGDFNADGLVDVNDFTILTSHWLQSVEPYQNGDSTGDGRVNLADFQQFKHELFIGDSATLNSIHVPEPSSFIIGLVTSFACCRRSRHVHLA